MYKYIYLIIKISDILYLLYMIRDRYSDMVGCFSIHYNSILKEFFFIIKKNIMNNEYNLYVCNQIMMNTININVSNRWPFVLLPVLLSVLFIYILFYIQA